MRPSLLCFSSLAVLFFFAGAETEISPCEEHYVDWQHKHTCRRALDEICTLEGPYTALEADIWLDVETVKDQVSSGELDWHNVQHNTCVQSIFEALQQRAKGLLPDFRRPHKDLYKAFQWVQACLDPDQDQECDCPRGTWCRRASNPFRPSTKKLDRMSAATDYTCDFNSIYQSHICLARKWECVPFIELGQEGCTTNAPFEGSGLLGSRQCLAEVCEQGTPCVFANENDAYGMCTCNGKYSRCPDGCQDLTVEPNCGKCGHTCGLNEECDDGTCVCIENHERCNGRCTDITTLDNCGACGNKCGDNALCLDGQCACPEDCGFCPDGSCVDITTFDNCGTCGNACMKNGVCDTDGVCRCPSADYAFCDGACTDLTSTDNCGACGVRCRHWEACYQGICQEMDDPMDIEIVFTNEPDPDTEYLRVAIHKAARVWEGILRHGLPTSNLTEFGGPVVDDIQISAEFTVIDGPGGILGQAGARWVRTMEDWRSYPHLTTITGLMQFDSADLGIYNEATLEALLLHEMAHVLGFSDWQWWRFNPPLIWCDDNTYGCYYECDKSNFWGPSAASEYSRITGQRKQSIPLENERPGSCGAHWERDLFPNYYYNPLMTPSLHPRAPIVPLTSMAIGVFRDMGYRAADMAEADKYQQRNTKFDAQQLDDALDHIEHPTPKFGLTEKGKKIKLSDSPPDVVAR